MNAASSHNNISLDWCLKFGHQAPADLITARNVLDHVLSHARQSAFTAEELAAVAAAEKNCRAALGNAVVIA